MSQRIFLQRQSSKYWNESPSINRNKLPDGKSRLIRYSECLNRWTRRINFLPPLHLDIVSQPLPNLSKRRRLIAEIYLRSLRIKFKSVKSNKYRIKSMLRSLIKGVILSGVFSGERDYEECCPNKYLLIFLFLDSPLNYCASPKRENYNFRSLAVAVVL